MKKLLNLLVLALLLVNTTVFITGCDGDEGMEDTYEEVEEGAEETGEEVEEGMEEVEEGMKDIEE